LDGSRDDERMGAFRPSRRLTRQVEREADFPMSDVLVQTPEEIFDQLV